MNFEYNTFYKGLTIGIITGMVLNTIKDYIFNSKLLNRRNRINESGGSVQPGAKSPTTPEGEFKMALLVRHDLKMGKGKVAAQCSHAIVHCYEEGLRLNSKEINSWESNQMPLSIFKVADEETMINYKILATEKGFNTYIVVDAGRTQVAPRSKTVMACAVVSITTFNKGKLRGLPSKCARVVLRVPDLKTLECIQKQCKLFDIQTATFIENDQVTVLAIGPADESSINAQVQHLKLYS